MRKLLLILFCCISLFLNAQNFMNICGPGLSLYINRTGNFRAFRQDSAYRATGKFIIERRDTLNQQDHNDSIFISYRTIRSIMNGCYDTTNGSLLGRRVYKKGDGTFLFFNRYHDTITIKSHAGLNSSWKFCDITDSTWIEARVTDIIMDTVLGLTDPTKIITFQAKDHLGNNITHFLNQQTMKLSQHYGITKTFDFYFIPGVEITDSSVYYLAAKSHPVLGPQNLTWQDVYNFDVGDEFHMAGGYSSGGGPDWKSMEKVLGKQVFGNIDSVKYTMEYCGVTYFHQPPPNEEKVYDTIIETYNFHTMVDNGHIQDPPGFFKTQGYGNMAPCFNRFIKYPGRQTQAYYSTRYVRTSGCWSDPYRVSFSINDYSEGLGDTYIHSEDWTEDIPYIWSKSLVYYKKGSEIWGTPLEPNCNILVPVEENTNKQEMDIKVNPNPVETRAEILLCGFEQNNLHFILVNSFSQQILSGEIQSNSFILERSSLPSGLYILTVTDDKNNILGRKKIVFE
jgi:hypothetical protein